jgi:predicted helicase
VDTLDNMGFEHTGKQLNFFGLTDANSERIVKQNSKPIMLVIGNPPYNAWQENFNNQNANRQYPEIDKRIKDTYIKQGTAQNQIAIYDMYVRFLRWASDRVSKNGIVAFVSNSSFLDSRAYDGFRKVVAKEFNELYVVNLKGNARKSGAQRQREGGNVFDDQIKVGVAIYFFVRKEGQKGFRIHYTEIDDYASSQEKRAYLRESRLADLKLSRLSPDAKNNWLDITDNDWDDLMPMVGEPKAIFDLYSNGLKSQRDEWVYDYSKSALADKMKFFADVYQKTLADKKNPDKFQIKWSPDLESYLERGIEVRFDKKNIVSAFYRPYVKSNLYFDKRAIGRAYQLPNIFPNSKSENLAIWWKTGADRPQFALAVDAIPDLLPAGGSICFPLYRYSESGERVENVTDWALGQFKRKYESGKMKDEGKTKKDSSFISHPSSLTKLDIFHYVYAVLHHPAYRAKYEINLKREFPRIPFYEDFWKWAGWGKRLMELHLGYEAAAPFKLERLNVETLERSNIQTRLMARKERGEIEIDTQTTLRGVPAEAWEYRLGTYSALEWILERYKEKKPKDPTIAEKFNTYRLWDYREQVIDLLCRVCTVSVETMKIVKEMPG